jgi:hypothetical protein
MSARRLPSPFYLVLVATALLATGAQYTVPITAGTSISAHLVETLSSTSSSAGQTFQIVAAAPLVVQGRVVVFKDAHGQGHVVSATPVKDGHQANVVVQFDWMTAVDGTHLPIVASLTSKGTGTLTFGLSGPFAHNFVKGKNIEVGPDLAFPTYLSSDRVVTVTTAI